MKEENYKALIVAYYLSRFNKVAYSALGFEIFNNAHEVLGRILSVKPTTLKNMRDEFDPIHDNNRKGWYQKPLIPSRRKIVSLFENLNEDEMRDIVQGILSDTNSDYEEIIETVLQLKDESDDATEYTIRGITGAKAESLFIENYKDIFDGFNEINDKRNDGCGYDFLLIGDEGELFVEVKGLNSISGGVSFTSKEWHVAEENGDKYFLVIVKNISEEYFFQVIRNPYNILSAKKQVSTVVQIRWNVPGANLPIL